MPHIGGRALARLLRAGEATTGPVYLWLADGVQALVAEGRLLHDTRLPSERDLVDALGVSRTTVTRAYAVLQERGWAIARRGSGTVVTLPGGPVPGGGEPLPEWEPASQEFAAIDMRRAAPPATPDLRRAVEHALGRLPAYVGGAGYFPLGIDELREQIADRYTRRGVATRPDQIIVTAGALSAINAVADACVHRGSRVVIESPSYPHAAAVLRRRGARLIPIPMTEEGPDEVARTQALAAGADLMMSYPDFHNPTGALLDDDGRARLARQWREAGVTGVVDESIAEAWLDEEPQVAPMAAHSPECISLGSVSKVAWGGLRTGWIRSPRPMVGTLARARFGLDLGSPVLDQLVTAEVMRANPSLHPDVRDRLRAGRTQLLQLRDQGWTVRVPTGGLSLWWRLPQPRATALVQAAGRRGVLLEPGTVYAAAGQRLEQHLRTPFAVEPAVLADAAALIADAWAEVTADGPGRAGKVVA